MSLALKSLRIFEPPSAFPRARLVGASTPCAVGQDVLPLKQANRRLRQTIITHPLSLFASSIAAPLLREKFGQAKLAGLDPYARQRTRNSACLGPRCFSIRCYRLRQATSARDLRLIARIRLGSSQILTRETAFPLSSSLVRDGSRAMARFGLLCLTRSLLNNTLDTAVALRITLARWFSLPPAARSLLSPLFVPNAREVTLDKFAELWKLIVEQKGSNPTMR